MKNWAEELAFYSLRGCVNMSRQFHSDSCRYSINPVCLSVFLSVRPSVYLFKLFTIAEGFKGALWFDHSCLELLASTSPLSAGCLPPGYTMKGLVSADNPGFGNIKSHQDHRLHANKQQSTFQRALIRWLVIGFNFHICFEHQQKQVCREYHIFLIISCSGV